METNPNLPATNLPSGLDTATFEGRLASDARWALNEGSLFFEDKGAVQESLRRVAKRLNELGVPYAVAGGMALFQHGYRRFTEDVDILVTREGLKTIHQALDGLGYVRPFERSKNLRDAVTGVKIEFLVSGDYPGDGRPKAVQFPDPTNVAIECDGIRFLSLPALVELKLASGITGADRLKDLADVQELIKLLTLPRELNVSLEASVREKYLEIWDNVHRRMKRFIGLAPQNVETQQLEAWRAAGVTIESLNDGRIQLVTSDPQIAAKYGLIDEADHWPEDLAD